MSRAFPGRLLKHRRGARIFGDDDATTVPATTGSTDLGAVPACLHCGHATVRLDQHRRRCPRCQTEITIIVTAHSAWAIRWHVAGVAPPPPPTAKPKSHTRTGRPTAGPSPRTAPTPSGAASATPAPTERTTP